MTELNRLFSELKRRKVFRVAGVYAVVAWALLEVADVLGPALLLPDVVTRAVAFLVILGFPGPVRVLKKVGGVARCREAAPL